jgi:hypothetical protein
MAALEHGVKLGLRRGGVGFPAPLAACLLLFGFLLALECAGGGELAQAVADALSPGAALLGRWLPVFFVPGLAMLPLAPSVGGPVEVSATPVAALGSARDLQGFDCVLAAAPRPDSSRNMLFFLFV